MTSDVSGIIFDLRRYAINDGPGIRTTVFFKGCPLGCSWCHNPESQSPLREVMYQEKLCLSCGQCAKACPTGARLWCGEEVSALPLVQRLLRDRSFFDQSGGGVTFSGGEPLAQPEFLLQLLSLLKKEEVHCTVDTSGYAPPSVIAAVAPFCDLFLYDLKIMDTAKHRHYTGVDNELILSNLQLLATLQAQVIIRVPLIPGINNSVPELQEMASFIRSLPYPVDFIPYHNLPQGKYRALGRAYQLEHITPPTPSELQLAKDIINFETP